MFSAQGRRQVLPAEGSHALRFMMGQGMERAKQQQVQSQFAEMMKKQQAGQNATQQGRSGSRGQAGGQDSLMSLLSGLFAQQGQGFAQMRQPQMGQEFAQMGQGFAQMGQSQMGQEFAQMGQPQMGPRYTAPPPLASGQMMFPPQARSFGGLAGNTQLSLSPQVEPKMGSYLPAPDWRSAPSYGAGGAFSAWRGGR